MSCKYSSTFIVFEVAISNESNIPENLFLSISWLELKVNDPSSEFLAHQLYYISCSRLIQRSLSLHYLSYLAQE